jgi:hypothetical protein
MAHRTNAWFGKIKAGTGGITILLLSVSGGYEVKPSPSPLPDNGYGSSKTYLCWELPTPP